jgi:SAM-dependent methyltransferase
VERDEYERLDATEDRMWWFRATHANLVAAFESAGAPAGAVLDAGCGTGGLLRRLAAALPGRSVLGLDADSGASLAARRKSGRPVCVGSVDALPFADESLAGIFSADVLCHRNVDERAALASFHRCLARGGVLVLNLPAYGWLLSGHDEAVHNVRRYTARGAVALLRDAGFASVRATYWNTFLFPLMVLRRKVLDRFRAGSDVAEFPGPVDRLFRGVTAVETALLRAGLTLPFGGSILAVAVKHG